MSFTINAFGGKEEEIVEKYYEANGIQKLKEISTMLIKGYLNYMGVEVKFTTYYKNPEQIRNETQVEDQLYIGVFDGDSGWASQQGQTIDLPPQAKKNVTQFVDLLLGPLYKYNKDNTELKLVGREKLDNQDVFKLNFKQKEGGEEADLFISTKDYRLLQLIANSQETGEIKFAFKDIKNIEGIYLPHTIQINVQNIEQVINYDSIQLNVPVEDSIFAKP